MGGTQTVTSLLTVCTRHSRTCKLIPSWLSKGESSEITCATDKQHISMLCSLSLYFDSFLSLLGDKNLGLETRLILSDGEVLLPVYVQDIRLSFWDQMATVWCAVHAHLCGVLSESCCEPLRLLVHLPWFSDLPFFRYDITAITTNLILLNATCWKIFWHTLRDDAQICEPAPFSDRTNGTKRNKQEKWNSVAPSWPIQAST